MSELRLAELPGGPRMLRGGIKGRLDKSLDRRVGQSKESRIAEPLARALGWMGMSMAYDT